MHLYLKGENTFDPLRRIGFYYPHEFTTVFQSSKYEEAGSNCLFKGALGFIEPCVKIATSEPQGGCYFIRLQSLSKVKVKEGVVIAAKFSCLSPHQLDDLTIVGFWFRTRKLGCVHTQEGNLLLFRFFLSRFFGFESGMKVLRGDVVNCPKEPRLENLWMLTVVEVVKSPLKGGFDYSGTGVGVTCQPGGQVVRAFEVAVV